MSSLAYYFIKSLIFFKIAKQLMIQLYQLMKWHEQYPIKTRNVSFRLNMKTNYIQSAQITLLVKTVTGVALNSMLLLIVDGECAMENVNSRWKRFLFLVGTNSIVASQAVFQLNYQKFLRVRITHIKIIKKFSDIITWSSHFFLAHTFFQCRIGKTFQCLSFWV